MFYRTSYSRKYDIHNIALIRKTIRTQERRIEKSRLTGLVWKNTGRKKNKTDIERNIEEKLKERISNQSWL